jgi:hypothetical protein
MNSQEERLKPNSKCSRLNNKWKLSKLSRWKKLDLRMKTTKQKFLHSNKLSKPKNKESKLPKELKPKRRPRSRLNRKLLARKLPPKKLHLRRQSLKKLPPKLRLPLSPKLKLSKRPNKRLLLKLRPLLKER